MESKIRALKYQVQQVGKHIKSSKKRYFWSLCIGQRYYNFVMDDSLVSGKSKLSINGKVFHQTEQSGLQRSQYDHSFIIEGCLFNITENQRGYQMRVNNKLFTHMLTIEMGSNSFQDHKVDQSAFQLAGKIKQNQNKKITLNLPGMANGMKKKKGAAQTENWNDFAGSNNFPNYFGQAQIKKPALQVKSQIPNLPLPKAEQVQCSKQQFSTLHNLFKTITASGQYVQKSAQGVTPTYEINQIPSIPQINLQEFNTMQNLFSTINNAQQLPKQEPSKQTFQTKSIQDLFSTLQITEKQKCQPKNQINSQFFKTKVQVIESTQKSFNTINKPKESLFPTINAQNLTQYNMNDFNTLQNLFATGLNVPKQNAIVEPQPQKNQQEQFFTIKPSFQSNFHSKVEDKSIPQQKIVNLSNININDFNTMQNLFATNLHKDALTATNKINKVEQPLKTQSTPNSIDFNTMQNLFATKGGKVQTNENNFWQF